MENRIFTERERTTGGYCRCASCNYPFITGEQVSLIECTGDIIHTACWDDYAADNASAFLSDISAS